MDTFQNLFSPASGHTLIYIPPRRKTMFPLSKDPSNLEIQGLNRVQVPLWLLGRGSSVLARVL